MVIFHGKMLIYQRVDMGFVIQQTYSIVGSRIVGKNSYYIDVYYFDLG